MSRLVAFSLVLLLWSGVASADEAPISGSVEAVDATARTVTIETTSKGKTRQVTVHLKDGARVVKFVRGSGPGASGFVEQAVPLAELKPGWIVSIATTHEGGKEVADVVKVVLER